MRTALFQQHLQLGAKIVDFAGWEMPLQYSGILDEQRLVRTQVGMFDVSHMGRVWIEGPGAEALLDWLSTSSISSHPPFSAVYTAWCLPDGGTLDDLIIYRCGPERFFAVFNASNREKDLEHLKRHAAHFDLSITSGFESDSILAVQGPLAWEAGKKIFPEIRAISPRQVIETSFENETIQLTGTGYTGAGGFELFGSHLAIQKLWDRLLEAGKPFGIGPAGLGARDLLRLEMGYALYGHELDESIAPIESVMAWSVKLSLHDFLGKPALLELAKSPKKRHQVGLQLIGEGVARQNYPVFKDGCNCGTITSGGYSPTLAKSIAIALVDKALPVETIIDIGIRKNLCKAEVVALPFIKVEKR